MRPSAPADENTLEELIARHPEIVAEEEGELLLVRRQQGVPDTEGGLNRWALDVLFVTRNAVPVLIEVKRAANSELRRHVVGQLLDYAANGTAYWQPGEVRRSFEINCEKLGELPDTVLEQFLGSPNTGSFWSQVDANLAAGRMRLVIAADVIPAELARVVEFLNDQMRPAEVHAVELGWFEGGDGRKTLVPRVVGVTERARTVKTSTKPRMTPEEWIAEHYEEEAPETASGIRWHIQILEKLGVESVVTERHDGIAGKLGNRFPFYVYRKNHGIALSLGNHHSLRRDLVAAVGDLDADNKQWPRFHAARLNHSGSRLRYEEVATTFIREIKAGKKA